MSYLLDAFTLALCHHRGLIFERSEGVVRCACYGDAALEAVGVVVHDAVECIGGATHHHIPQQALDVHVHRLGRTRLALVAGAIVALTQHHGEVAHSRAPFLRHGVRFGSKGECMLALGVRQTLGEVGDGVVQREAAHRQLGLLGLFLLVLRCTLLRAPLLFLLLVHRVERLDFAHPRLHDGVYAAFARSKVACDVGNEVESLLLPVNIQLHPRRQRTYAGADGCHYWHCQLRAHGVDAVLDALRQFSDRPL